MGYFYLACAILSEVIGTLALNHCQEFTKLVPSAVVVVGYCLSFYFLSLVLRYVTMGVAYAVWSGVGIVLIATLGVFLYDQVPDVPAIVGMGLIIAGVIVINLFSDTATH